MNSFSEFSSRLTLFREPQLLYQFTFVSLLLVQLTPLIVDSRLYFPFVSSKVIFFRILVEVSLVSYIFLAFKVPRFRLQFHAISILAGIFLGAQVLAGAWGEDFSRSLWGNLERGEGLLTLTHLFIFFLLMATLMRSSEDRILVVFVWLTVAFIVAGLALLEFSLADLPVRPKSTLGNPSFLAGYLLLSLFLAFWMHASVQSSWIRRSLWFLEGWIFAAMILTGTRSSIIGAIVGGGLVLAALWSSKVRTSNRKRAGLGLVVLALLISVILGWQDNPLNHRFSFLQRLASTSLDSQSARVRVLIWKSGMEAVAEEPLLGYGPENLNVAFDRHSQPELFSLSPGRTWVDRSHNILLDIALTSGLTGVLVFLFLCGAIFLSLRRSWVRHNQASTLIIGGAFFAFFAEAQFSVPNVCTQLGFWLLAALAVQIDHQKAARKPSPRKLNPRRESIIIVAVALVIAAPAVWAFNLTQERVCRNLANAAEASGLGQRDLAIVHFQKAIEQPSRYTPDACKILAETILGWYAQVPGGPVPTPAHVNYAVQTLQTMLDNEPKDAKGQFLLVMLYNRSAQLDEARADLALSTAKTALLLAPTRPQIYFELGQAHLFKEDFGEALTAFRSAVELAPSSVEARWNLAVALELSGRDQEAAGQFQNIRGLGADLSDPRYLRRLVAVYQATGQTEKLRQVLNQLAVLESDNAAWKQLLDGLGTADRR